MKTLAILLTVLLAGTSTAQVSHTSIVFHSSARALSSHEIKVPLWPTNAGDAPLAIDATLPVRLQAAMEATYAKTSLNGKHGVSASVIVPGLPQWSGSVGESYPGEAMSNDMLFEIASNTKTITTALILKLQEEGKLSITDSLWKWLPHYNNIDSNITIKQLLEHSSGIYDYLNDDTTGSMLDDAYFYDPTHVWTPEEIVSEHIGAPNFKAGKSYKYSNTNFVLLGMIAKAVAGKEVAVQFRERFFDPMSLSHTVAGWAEDPKGVFTHNWLDSLHNEPMVDIGTIDKTAQLTMAHTAGGGVSTPADLCRWAKALYEGTTLNSTSMKQMLTFHNWPDGTSYGLGVSKAPYKTKTFYGHTGGLPGFSSHMFSNPKDTVTLVVYMNSIPSDVDVVTNDYTLAILNEIYAPAASVKNNSLHFDAQVFPNPVATISTISYELSQPSNVRLSLFDMLGREVLSTTSLFEGLGKHALKFDASSLPVGCYRYRLVTGAGIAT
ncbi:MAG TPA: serine hydrolase, partial [Candidatus Kapabacteria bacterium]|nr:serine hydrolase [Candidatus Kapabacteria bacterium]